MSDRTRRRPRATVPAVLAALILTGVACAGTQPKDVGSETDSSGAPAERPYYSTRQPAGPDPYVAVE